MMVLVVLSLAALAGILLAAFERPHDGARTERLSVLLLVSCAVTTAAGVAVAVAD